MSKSPAIALAVLSALSSTTAAAADPPLTAEILIRSDHPRDLWHFRTYEDSANCKGISAPLRETDWLKMNANEQFTFFFSGASNSDLFRYKYCWSNATVTPEQGGKYVATFSFGEKVCGVSIVRVSDKDLSSPVPEKFFLRTYEPPFLQSGSWCGKRLEK